ncbi:MAG: nucleotidyltransferase family protein [Clostridiales bacterium]|nr:nucleotidyltransferase family protein [Clostridiales bacterium]
MIYGIAAEFNPFHAGHRHLVESVKQPGDAVVAVMSGNFVQRGGFAIYDKWNRAQAALKGGVDLVIELPTPYALKSAQGFARAAVGLLDACGCVDAVAFGAETPDLDALRAAAGQTADPAVQARIAAAMEDGLSYAAARSRVIQSPLLDTPNNILAVEYLSALNHLNSGMEACAVQRIGSAHDSMEESKGYPSASALRARLQNQQAAGLCLMERCEAAVLDRLRRMERADFARIEDVNEGLEHKFYQAVRLADSLESVYNGVKSKRYALSRIRRIVLRAYLGLEREQYPSPPYLRVLGFSPRGLELLRDMKHCANLPVLTTAAQCKALEGEAAALFSAECRWTDLHALGYHPPRPCGREWTEPVRKWKD